MLRTWSSQRSANLWVNLLVAAVFLAASLSASNALAADDKKDDKSGKKNLISKDKFTYTYIRNDAQKMEGNVVSVIPESTTQIYLSSTDVNRIVCKDREVKDVIYSEEKGVKVKLSGNSAFVKYVININQATNEKMYVSSPTDMHVVCSDNSVYTLIISPKPCPSQTVHLVTGNENIKENLSVFEGMPLERKAAFLISSAYQDKLAETFDVKNDNRRIGAFKNLEVSLRRTVIVNGEGLTLKEYVLAKNDLPEKTEMNLSEKDFLIPELSKLPLAISLEPKPLKKDNTVRLFIVERTSESVK